MTDGPTLVPYDGSSAAVVQRGTAHGVPVDAARRVISDSDHPSRVSTSARSCVMLGVVRSREDRSDTLP